MTKKKVIEDLIKHCDNKYYYGNNWVVNGYVAYKDEELPEMEMESTLSENIPEKMDYIFSDTLRLSEAIEIDKAVLKEWIRNHKRREKIPFTIGVENESEISYIFVNPWYLRNQFEYVKDNRIFIQPEKFRDRYGYSAYIGGIYSFSEDFNKTKCVTLPIFWAGDFTVDYMVKGENTSLYERRTLWQRKQALVNG